MISFLVLWQGPRSTEAVILNIETSNSSQQRVYFSMSSERHSTYPRARVPARACGRTRACHHDRTGDDLARNGQSFKRQGQHPAGRCDEQRRGPDSSRRRTRSVDGSSWRRERFTKVIGQFLLESSGKHPQFVGQCGETKRFERSGELFRRRGPGARTLHRHRTRNPLEA